MSDPIGYIIAGIIGGCFSLIPYLLRRRLDAAQVDKTEAEEAEKLTQIAMDLLTPLRERIRELEVVVNEQAQRINYLSQKLEVAENLIKNQDKQIRRLTQKLQAAQTLIDDLIRQLNEAGLEPHFGKEVTE